jgi:hypothetical protein
MFSRLFKKTESVDDRLEFVMKVQGHKLYKFTSLSNMSQFRFIGLKLSLEKMGLGVRPSDSITYNKIQRELDADLIAAFKENDSATFYNVMEQKSSLRSEYEFQLDSFASRRLMVEIGGIGIIVDDEPIEKFSKKHNKIKEKLLEDDDVLAFFLDNTLSYIAQLRKDITGSLVMQVMEDSSSLARAQVFSRKIGISEFRNLWSPTMVKLSGFLNDSEEEDQKT